VEGTCPVCGYEHARGDQCEQCSSVLDATELIHPRSKTDGSTPIVRETEHFFLDLPAFSQRLLPYIEAHAEDWRPNVVNFTRNFIEAGLKGRPVTRDIEWGVPVPIPGWEGKCLYVWFEAVMGYFTASVEWANNTGQPEAWKDWWYDPQARIYNFIGKDNIPFHTIIWPAELLGVDGIYQADATRHLNLPYDVPANEFMNIEGAKFSKSRKWAIWLPDILSRFDPDPIRFYVTSVMPESRDTDYSWSDFVRRNNDELVATWGNLANRVLSFAYRHWDGQVPVPGELRPMDIELLQQVENGFDTVGALLERVHLREALAEALALARAVNGYLDRAPWFGVIKQDKAAAATTVYTALRAIDSLKILLSPFLPFTSERLHQMLGYAQPLFGEQRVQSYQERQRSHEALIYDGSPGTGAWRPSALPPGQILRQPAPLYRKLEDSVAAEEQARLGAPHA
jgi:methionyl-tRNA synthetase